MTSAEPWAGRPPVQPRDIGVACTFALLAVLAQILLPFEPASHLLGHSVPAWTGLGLQLVGCTALIMRTTRPAAVLLLTAPTAAASIALDAGPVSALLLFEAVFTAVRHGSPCLHRVTSILCLGLTATALLAALSFPELRHAWTQLLINVGVVLILPLLWAGEVRGHEQAREQAERAAGAEREAAARQLELEQTRAALRLQEQRTHLARELHDGVTGHLSAVALQTGALHSSASLRQDPAALERSLDTVRASALEAMADMRRLIDVLRTDSPATAGTAGWDGLAARLGALRPDAEIDVQPEAAARLEAAGIDEHALRLGQEAVTNVLKHASTGAVSLSLRLVEDRPVLTLDSPLGASPSGLGESGLDGSGVGLVSMRRRAAETGGELQAGPLDERTWRVRAAWPATAAPEHSPGCSPAAEPLPLTRREPAP